MYQRSVRRLLVSSMVCAAAMAGACGGGKDPAPPLETEPPLTGMGNNSGDGDGDGDDVPDDEFNQPGAPIVEVEVGDGTEAVFSTSIDVTCTVSQSEEEESLQPDSASVQIQLRDADGEEIDSPSVDTGDEAGEFTATIPVADVPAGEYSVRCIASDLGETPKWGMDEVTIYVDHGPTIEAISPVSEEFLSAADLVNFEFRISPNVLFSGDDEAEIDGTPVAFIHGTEFELTLKPGTDDVYWVEALDLDNPATFEDGVPIGETFISVRAANARGIVAELAYDFAVDGAGPTVAITSPDHLDIIGNAVTFTFVVEDDYSGVDWETLVVHLANQSIAYETSSGRWQRNGDVVRLSIQTREYAAAVQMSINLDVTDLAGNPRMGAATATYYLDQFPPLISLDPPLFRGRRNQDSLCSRAFDPVGDAAENHGDDTDRSVLIRGIVWDQTNGTGGVETLLFSTVDPGSVELWVAPAGVPLVIDSDDDLANACDNVDVDAPNAQVVEVGPVVPNGDPFYGSADGDSSNPPLVSCDYKSSPDSSPPNNMCQGNTSDMYWAIGHNAGTGNTPAVYTFGVGGTTSQTCTGVTFEMQSFLGNNFEGWVCAAMVASDQVGNRSVSAPMALCVSNQVDPPPACAGSGAAGAPDCTDGCTPATFPAEGILVRDFD